MMARPITMPVGGAERLHDAGDDQRVDRGGGDGGERGDDVERQPRQHHRPPAEAVGQRPEQKLRAARLSR